MLIVWIITTRNYVSNQQALCQGPLPVLSHLFSQQILLIAHFWKGEYRTEGWADKFAKDTELGAEVWATDAYLFSLQRLEHGFFCLKLWFSLSYSEWIINYNRALRTSSLPGPQGSISVRGCGCHQLGNYSCSSPCQRESGSSLGTERGRAMIQNENPAPRGSVWYLYW